MKFIAEIVSTIVTYQHMSAEYTRVLCTHTLTVRRNCDMDKCGSVTSLDLLGGGGAEGTTQ